MKIFPAILRILGMLLMFFSLSMLPPLFLELIYNDGEIQPFFEGFSMTFNAGAILWLLYKNHKREFKTTDGFLIVVLFWVVLCSFAAIPLMVADEPHLSFTDAVFEAVSGLTTTGATILSGIDYLPHSIRFYRQQLHFLGGMGIIVLAIAVIPMLGVGGLQLYRAEVSSPIKDSKLTPRLTQTAKSLWVIYITITFFCTLAYYAAGMTWFDAICESFSTISTGGFSPHDASFAYYQSSTVEFVGVIFMILGATNFSLHFFALQQKTIIHFWRDEEFRVYIALLALITLITALVLLTHHIKPYQETSFMAALFTVVSLSTTTGAISSPFADWPTFVPYLLVLVSLIGGCAGSTSGGIKVIRLLLLYKQCLREIHRLIHPKAVMSIKFGNNVLPEPVIQSMWAFIAAFMAIFSVLCLFLLADGLNLKTAFSALAACISNTGAGIGDIANGFAGLSNISKWTLVIAMLAGRLEIFTLLVLFSPTFWRR